ncbi:hypothetical protein K2173_013051 [Erythroxylum novogranatense]|uniref:Dienelactone hydrolase domain-containing protein n=1 Tax=Erythroxylum novogranatense TaxID=1862640 RepID=A0AAV8S685_9ROSI|nr:hypothetical protein K2173_013051 [Erythroxylum novogranatense]
MSGPQCCENPPTLNPASGVGRTEKVGGLDCYVVGAPDSKRAILLASDVFGFEAPNFRKLADKIAAAGFYVVVPDYIYGDPFVPEKTDIQTWLKSHSPDKITEDVKPVIDTIKSQGASEIGAAGFCLGAKVVVQLANSGFIQVAVLLHPSFVTVDHIKEVKVPISILGAENDQMSPPELLKQFEDILTAKSEVASHVKIFPKVSHGWTVRYSVEDEAAVKAANEAHGDMLEWFAKYVK